MKSFVRIGLTFLGILFISFIHAQVTGVKYFMKYNVVDTAFDCYFVITDGSALSALERTQFNAQYTIVVPTKTKISVKKSHSPLYNNQNSQGNSPMDWAITTIIKSPQGFRQSDYYCISPILFPSAQYNHLSSGDSIKLFSIKVDNLVGCIGDIRLFDNILDNVAGLPFNADISNGFTIGNINQVYLGNLNVADPTFIGSSDLITSPGSTLILKKPSNIKGIWRMANPTETHGIALETLANGDASLSIDISVINKSYTVIYQTDTALYYTCIRVQNINSSITEDQVPKVTIYPIPAYDYVQILADCNIVSYQIIDVLGKLLEHKKMGNTTQFSISLQGFEPGHYFLTIQTDKGQAYKKLEVR